MGGQSVSREVLPRVSLASTRLPCRYGRRSDLHDAAYEGDTDLDGGLHVCAIEPHASGLTLCPA